MFAYPISLTKVLSDSEKDCNSSIPFACNSQTNFGKQCSAITEYIWVWSTFERVAVWSLSCPPRFEPSWADDGIIGSVFVAGGDSSKEGLYLISKTRQHQKRYYIKC